MNKNHPSVYRSTGKVASSQTMVFDQVSMRTLHCSVHQTAWVFVKTQPPVLLLALDSKDNINELRKMLYAGAKCHAVISCIFYSKGIYFIIEQGCCGVSC